MKSLLLSAMMLCACVFMPGCSGSESEEDVEVICEEAGVTVSYDNRVMFHQTLHPYHCDLELVVGGKRNVTIELTNNGDTPVDVITWGNEARAGSASNSTGWYSCGDFEYFSDLTEMNVGGKITLEAELEIGGARITFDTPYSCDTPPSFTGFTGHISGTLLWSGATNSTFEGVLNSSSYYPVFIEEGRSADVKLIGGDENSRFVPCIQTIGGLEEARERGEDYTCDQPGTSDLSLSEEGYTYLGYVYASYSGDWKVRFSGDVVGGSDVMIQEVKGVANFDLQVSIS